MTFSFMGRPKASKMNTSLLCYSVPERGVKLSPEKNVICATEVSYFGHLLTAERVKPDPDKVTSVRDMELPKDKGELKTVQGIINYLSRFAPGLSHVNVPLWQLLKV